MEFRTHCVQIATGDIQGREGNRASDQVGLKRPEGLMISFLYSLPDLGVAILLGFLVALAFVAAPLLRARLFGRVSEANSEIARTTMTTITGFTGVVLAFSLVQAQGNLRNTEKTVASEAVQLNQMDRLLTSYGDAKVAAIREAVHAYAESVVTEEWPKLSEHGSSQRTADLLHTLAENPGHPADAGAGERDLRRSGEDY